MILVKDARLVTVILLGIDIIITDISPNICRREAGVHFRQVLRKLAIMLNAGQAVNNELIVLNIRFCLSTYMQKGMNEN